jgi:hypothetical protein
LPVRDQPTDRRLGMNNCLRTDLDKDKDKDNTSH